MTHTKEPTFEVNNTKVKSPPERMVMAQPASHNTINVFDHTDAEGHYQEVYRISDAGMYVTEADITANAKNLHELDRYLVGRGAVKEGSR